LICFNNTDTGTPQSGVISPLFANIALHGMEDELGVKYYFLLLFLLPYVYLT